MEPQGRVMADHRAETDVFFMVVWRPFDGADFTDFVTHDGMEDDAPTRFSSHSVSWPARPIIVITGANGGVGLGICKRLLDQLSTPHVSDLERGFPLPRGQPAAQSAFTTPNGLTLVLACRNAMKAHKTITELLEYIGKKKPQSGPRSAYWKETRRRRVLSNSFDENHEVAALLKGHRPLSRAEYMQLWLANLHIEFAALDLSSFVSTMQCCRELKSRYPYISHLMLHAGAAPFVGLDILDMTLKLLSNFVIAVTYPTYCIEKKGVLTDDGLGWTWQCNVFGHYVLAKELLSHIAASPLSSPRIIFTGSMDGLPGYFDPQHPQAVDSGSSYQSTKFQVGLLAWGFNGMLAREEPETRRVRSFLVHPGIVAGNMYREILGYALDVAMRGIFIIARWLGSPHHVVSAYLASMAFVFVALAPLDLIHSRVKLARSDVIAEKTQRPMEEDAELDWLPIRFGSRCTRAAEPYIGVDVVLPPGADQAPERLPWYEKSTQYIKTHRWWWDQEMAKDLIDYCEATRLALLEQSPVK